jgi:hypothetical protein
MNALEDSEATENMIVWTRDDDLVSQETFLVKKKKANFPGNYCLFLFASSRFLHYQDL